MPQLTLSPSHDAFVDAPVGCYVRGPTYLVWCALPTLCGATYWGSPTEGDTRALIRLYDIDARMTYPFDVVTDAHRVTGVDAGAFRQLLDFVRLRLPAFATRIRRNAIVRPDGVAGAMVSGLYHVAAPAYPWRLFDDNESAFAWLERDDARGVRADIQRLVDATVTPPNVVHALSAFLARNLRAPTLSRAARALGVSERSLQRALQAAGSSFRREVTQARILRAAELIEASDEKLEAIARQVGFAALPQLSSMFRRVTGESPSELRQRRRGGG